METIGSLGRHWMCCLPVCQPRSWSIWLHIPWDVPHFKGPLCPVHRDQGVQVLGAYKNRITNPGHEEKQHRMGLCLGTSESSCSSGKWPFAGVLAENGPDLRSHPQDHPACLPAFFPHPRAKSPSLSLPTNSLPPDVISHSSPSVSVSWSNTVIHLALLGLETKW